MEPVEWLTAALVLVTAYYAWQNYRMAEAMNAQRDEDHQRALASEKRIERSRRRMAARALLTELRSIPLTGGNYFGIETVGDVDEVQQAIEDYAFEFDDCPELQDRLEVLRAICYSTEGLPNHGGSIVEGTSQVSMWGRTIMDDLRQYLVSGDVPPWQKNMPRTRSEAVEKLRDRARESKWRSEQSGDDPDDFDGMLDDHNQRALAKWQRLRDKRDRRLPPHEETEG